MNVTVSIKNTSVTFNVPQSWNELSKQQLLYIADNWQVWKDLSKLNASLVRAKSLLFLKLSGLNKAGLRKLCTLLSFVDEGTDVNILTVCDFVFTKLTLTENLIPTVRVGLFKQFAGPASNLSDVTAEEFCFAFECYGRYVKTGSDDDLNNLVAVLYRPRTKASHYAATGENRQAFNDKLIGQHAAALAKVPYAFKVAVYLFFESCLDVMTRRFNEVFRRGESKTGESFLNTLVAMSGDTFGSFESTCKVNVYVFLTELNSKILAAREVKK